MAGKITARMLIAQLTDPHLGLDPGPLAGLVDPVANLRQALAHVRQYTPGIDVVLITGDLSDSGEGADYEMLAELLAQELPSAAQGGPLVLATPGNHDNAQAALRCLSPIMPVAADAPPGRICLHEVHGGLHFIGLDTSVPGSPQGQLDPAQLDWLARTLRACHGEPVMIFMHHPPILTGMQMMDSMGLVQGRAELTRLVAEHGGVQAIASGHLHRPVAGSLGGAPVLIAPSTSHQLELDLREGASITCRLEPPMIGLYRWTPADGMACHLSYVERFGEPYGV